MNILRLLLQNIRKGTITEPNLPTSQGYRGLVGNDESRCVGCGACAYVCPTGAIEVTRAGDSYSWSYDPGKCTFCARCIDKCRPNTLTMDNTRPPIYEEYQGLKVIYNMQRKKPAPKPPVAAPAKPAAAPAPATSVVTGTAPTAAGAAAAVIQAVAETSGPGASAKVAVQAVEAAVKAEAAVPSTPAAETPAQGS